MSNLAARRIVIVGGGTAGWMTAAALGRLLAAEWSIKLVESDEIGTIGVGEATIPSINMFNEALGIDEAEFLSATGGTYKLGIAFEGWGHPERGYVHAFGLVGSALGVIPFHHYWLRGLKLGISKPLGHYVLHTLAIAANRFDHVRVPANSALPPMPYAFHFDASLYAKFLRGFAEARGVVRQEGKIVAVERNGESGDIDAVVLADGSRVAGDLFVDCSGFRGLLIEQELEAGFEDWTQWLQCDRAIAVPCARVDPLIPLTRSIARKAGWQWRIPLQHRIGNGYVFKSSEISEDEAAATLLANLAGKALAEPRTIRFKTGRRSKTWVRNVVAIGLSSGFIEPLESTSIHLIQTGITRLIELLPAGEITDATRDDYNARSAFEMERIRDFIILHYHANGRVGEPFWDGLRTMEVPEPLQHKIDLFRSTARVVPSFDELFDTRAWIHVMIGQDIIPESYHPIADQLPEERLREFLDGLERAHMQQVAQMPEHGEFVARFGPVKRELIPA
ncbi:MAG: tryptophan 7-halogenase [Sphingomonas sp.]|nr:tryptophan 7-halogenase [Sphingomonas sp.]